MTIEEKIHCYSFFNEIPASLIRQYIPKRPGFSPSKSFKFLLAINLHPGFSMTRLKALFNSHSETQSIPLNYLLDLGFVKTSKKKYWVKMLNAYRLDTVYFITPSGKSCIFSIFRKFEEKCVVNSEINTQVA